MEVKKAENEAKSLALKAEIATKQEEERLEAERKATEEEATRLRALQATTPVIQATQNNGGGEPQKLLLGQELALFLQEMPFQQLNNS